MSTASDSEPSSGGCDRLPIMAGGAAPLIDGLARWRRRGLREQRAMAKNDRQRGQWSLGAERRSATCCGV